MSEAGTEHATGADKAYFAGLEAGEVRIQSCADCGRVHWPAVFRCPECGSWDHRWQKVNPSGKVFSWTRTWHDFGAPKELKPPFVTLVVSLSDAEQVRLIGTFDDSDAEIRIGQDVTAHIDTFDFHGRKVPALVWSGA